VATYLAGLGIVAAINPPHVLDLEVTLKVQQQVGRGHHSSSEKMVCHPTLLKVVWCGSVDEDVNEDLTARLQGPCHLGHDSFVVLDMLKHLVTAKMSTSFPTIPISG
jgi:hypothetical protein